MKLEFGRKYKSIGRFNPVDLEQFSIITGKNGSGKTHLLESIKRGSCRIDSIDTRDIVLFDLIAFTIENEAEYETRKITEEKNNAWSVFGGKNQNTIYNIKILAGLADQYLTKAEKIFIKDLAAHASKPVMQVDATDFMDESLAAKFTEYKDRFHKIFSSDDLKNDLRAENTRRLAEKLDMFIDEIDKSRFVHDYDATVLKEDFLPAQLGSVFMNYRLTEYVDTDERRHGTGPAPEQHGSGQPGGRTGNKTTPPWEIINQFLAAYTGGRYSVTFPPPLTSRDVAYGSRSFRPQMRNAEKNIEIDYDSLSSGEKVLLMLALCMFKAESESVFPKLLLLDEVDATLHPSMIKNLLRVITGVLNKKGTRVVLATHSPTTVALAPDDCTYLVHPEGEDRIVKSPKNKAVAVLTEGYMTLDEGLHLLDQLTSRQLIVVSEGDNAAYIEAAIRLFAPDDADKIDVYDKIRANSGDGQLRTLFEFFSRARHETPIVVVWDPDYSSKGVKLTPSNNTYPFVLASNQNSRAKRGIESLFAAACFTNAELSHLDRPNRPVETSFDTDRKAVFRARMTSNPTREQFAGFKDLVEYIVNLLPDHRGVHEC